MIRYLDFILGGKAVFTVTNKVTGNHFTYRVSKMTQPNTHQWFVNLGIGYEDSIYMGMIRLRNGDYEFFRTAKSRMSEDAESVKTFKLLLAAANMDEDNSMIDSSGVLKFQHEGKCCVCARPLTNPESIESGIGPECRMKAAGFTHVTFQN